MKFLGLTVAALAVSMALAPGAEARARHSHHAVAGSWDGRWAGSWGGNDPTAVIVKGNKVVAYEYGGATNPVEWSKVSASHISYGESNIVVTLTRTGANTAHATIKTGQGNGTAELIRK
jgi:hypothetical protein